MYDTVGEDSSWLTYVWADFRGKEGAFKQTRGKGQQCEEGQRISLNTFTKPSTAEERGQ